MPDTRLPRKLAAILYADVAGYSRLTGRDEEGTHRRLSANLDLLSESIRVHSGTVVHTAGDAILAAFPTVTEAVSCAAYAQQALRLNNDALPEEDKVQFRIGVNLGEVIADRDDIYGDGVNVAARLESLAEPGGICVSEAVRSSVGTRLPLQFEFQGEQHVKNIAEPVRAYRVQLTSGARMPAPPGPAQPPTPSPAPWRRRPFVVGAALSVVVVAAGISAWLAPWAPSEERASIERMAFPLPDEPSIAVLPFDNLSGDPEQEYVSDGLTDNIITTLSQLPGVFVIARNSSFAYKGEAVKVQRVAEELGVRYVLEGSFQREGDQIRIHVQLIDALSGRHLWAERFDRTFAGIFALQDDVTRPVVSALEVELTGEQKARLASRYTDDIDAYDHFLRGQALYFRYTKDDNADARTMYQRAIDLDPDFARAHGALSNAHATDFRLGWSEDATRSLAQALALARRAVALDISLPQAHWALGQALAFDGALSEAIDAAETATALDRNYADAHALLAAVQTFAGRAELAIPAIDKAIRLNPQPSAVYASVRGRALLFLGRLEEARSALRTAVELNAAYLFAHVYLTAAYSHLGETTEAEWQAAEVLALEPGFSIHAWTDGDVLADGRYVEYLSEGLRKAGLPE